MKPRGFSVRIEDGTRRLLAAMLLQAARDAVDPHPCLAAEARHWLRWVGMDIATWLGLSRRSLVTWMKHLSPLAYEQLGLFDERGELDEE